MSQSAKTAEPQVAPRHGRAGPVARDALRHAETAMRRAGFDDPALVVRWREIAGAEVAELAEPVRCQRGAEGAILTLRCEPGAAVFLQHQTRELIGRLNAFLGPGAIARIRLIAGVPARPSEAPAHPSPSLAGIASAGPGIAGALARFAAVRRKLKK